MFRDLVSRALYGFKEGTMYVGIGGFYLAAISGTFLTKEIERPVIESVYEILDVPREIRINYSQRNELEIVLSED